MFPALSTISSVAEIAPVAVGEKLTAIVHVAPPGANELPQVVFKRSTLNTLLVGAMLLIATVPPGTSVLLLVTVMSLSALVVPTVTLPNESDVGASVSAESVPVPRIGIVAGLFLALLVMVRVPVRLPCAVGVNVTLTVHEASGGDTDPLGPRTAPLQVSSSVLKSPDAVTLPTVRATALGFVSVAVLTVALSLPTRVLVNNIAGETLISPAMPVPERVNIFGLLEAFEGMLSVPANFPTPLGSLTVAVAVKSTESWHVAPAANVLLEHESEGIRKFGDVPATPVVVAVIWPKVSVPAEPGAHGPGLLALT